MPHEPHAAIRRPQMPPAARRSSSLCASSASCHHVAVRDADGQEFVKGEVDPAVQQDPPGQGAELDAKSEEVVEMHHLAPDQLQELDEGLDMQEGAGLVPEGSTGRESAS